MKHEHSHHHQKNEKKSEVVVNAAYTSGKVTIKVRDKNNKSVPLAKSHGKRMHLVIVSADLENFLHAHPIENHSEDFEAALELLPGQYVAFVDINPVDMAYVIEPLSITVGEATALPPIDWGILEESDSSTKEAKGKTVTFQHPELVVGEPATLTFDLNGERPLPYLGALGHVVVVDEQGTRFIHVHPVSEDQTVFVAQFPSPGFYKLWVEFKFADTGVIDFPFIVKVDERS